MATVACGVIVHASQHPVVCNTTVVLRNGLKRTRSLERGTSPFKRQRIYKEELAPHVLAFTGGGMDGVFTDWTGIEDPDTVHFAGVAMAPSAASSVGVEVAGVCTLLNNGPFRFCAGDSVSYTYPMAIAVVRGFPGQLNATIVPASCEPNERMRLADPGADTLGDRIVGFAMNSAETMGSLQVKLVRPCASWPGPRPVRPASNQPRDAPAPPQPEPSDRDDQSMYDSDSDHDTHMIEGYYEPDRQSFNRGRQCNGHPRYLGYGRLKPEDMVIAEPRVNSDQDPGVTLAEDLAGADE